MKSGNDSDNFTIEVFMAIFKFFEQFYLKYNPFKLTHHIGANSIN